LSDLVAEVIRRSGVRRLTIEVDGSIAKRLGPARER
jgi:hypothetical protein